MSDDERNQGWDESWQMTVFCIATRSAWDVKDVWKAKDGLENRCNRVEHRWRAEWSNGRKNYKAGSQIKTGLLSTGLGETATITAQDGD